MSAPEQDHLRIAIEAAYLAFADQPAPVHLRAPSHRNPELLLCLLRAAPLSELTAEHLGPYASWAMTTVGTAADYRHFLPRIMELGTAPTAWPGLDPQEIAGKLVYGVWSSWPPSQRQAIADWVNAGFRASLELDPSLVREPRDWLTASARMRLPVGSLLLSWRDHRARPAVIGLANFVTSWSMALHEGDPVPPFWDNIEGATADTVKTWLFRRETLAQIERGAEFGDVDLALSIPGYAGSKSVH